MPQGLSPQARQTFQVAPLERLLQLPKTGRQIPGAKVACQAPDLMEGLGQGPVARSGRDLECGQEILDPLGKAADEAQVEVPIALELLTCPVTIKARDDRPGQGWSHGCRAA